MSDLISRADAIEAVAQQWLFEASVGNPYVNDDDIGEYRKLAEELFEDVPSADADAYTRITGLMPDAVQGEWEDREVFNETDDDHIVEEWQSARCSVCGKYHTTPYMYYFDDFNFCPNCGAKMKGGND